MSRRSEIKPFVLGITGSIGTGKSFVGKVLAEAGIPVIDTDLLVHELFSSDPALIASLTDLFGKEILKNGIIDRQSLGNIVFNDVEKRKLLEALVHPAVRREIARRREEFKNEPLIAELVPLLFEANLQSNYNQIWAVVASEELLIQRLQQRNGLTPLEAKQRIDSQSSQTLKAELADWTVNNSGTFEETKSLVLEKLKHLQNELALSSSQGQLL